MSSSYARPLPTLLLAVAACNAAAVDPSFWDRAAVPASTASSGPTDPTDPTDPDPADAAAASSSSKADCLQLTFTTKSYGGEYAPDNVGAVWIETADGTFVQTLETWGVKRLRNAVAWRAASGGNVVDAITGATRQAHGAHTVTWTCDTPGAYVARLELTEDDSAEGAPAGPTRQISFDTATAGSVDVADDATYLSISAVVTSP